MAVVLKRILKEHCNIIVNHQIDKRQLVTELKVGLVTLLNEGVSEAQNAWHLLKDTLVIYTKYEMLVYCRYIEGEV